MSVQNVTISTNGSTSTGNISRITFVNQAVTGPTGAGGSSTALDDLTDVTVTAAAAGDLLRYSGTAWVDYADSNYAAASSVSDHLADTTAAHAASAISFSATGSIAATDVQTAIAEVATDAAAAYQPLATVLTNTTASFTTAQESKLSGIESSADVTDAANVASAGAVMNTLIAAKGDLIVGSANDTPAILTAGTNDYVLTAASGEATGLKWAAAAGGGIRVEDEGTSTVAAATGINFVGAGVTVTDAGSNEATVTIAGGGSSDPLDGNAIVAQRIFVR